MSNETEHQHEEQHQNNPEEIDGCTCCMDAHNVTPDEDLPAASGGVN